MTRSPAKALGDRYAALPDPNEEAPIQMMGRRVFQAPARFILIALCSLAAAAGSLSGEGEAAPENPFRAAVAAAQPSLVIIRARFRRMKDVQGVTRLGILVADDGLIVSDGALRSEEYETTDLTVTFPGGPTCPCSYVGKDDDLNLAFLQIGKLEGRKFGPLAFANGGGAAPGIGDPLIAVGLLDEADAFAPQISRGIVTAITKNPFRPIQTDLALQGGLSFPCPVFGAAGRVVGLLASGSGSSLIPASSVAALVARPPRESVDQDADKAWLGIVMQALSPDLAEYWKIPEGRGVVVGAIVAGSPVERAGVKVGDVITVFDDWPIAVSQDAELPVLVRRVKATPVGKAVTLITYRDGVRKTVDVKLGSRPKSGLLADTHEDAEFGMAVREITLDHRLRLNLAVSDKGILVDRIEAAGWASLGGLRPFDIVHRVDNAPCEDVKSFKGIMERVHRDKPKKVVFMVKRGVDTEFVVVVPDWGGQKTEE